MFSRLLSVLLALSIAVAVFYANKLMITSVIDNLGASKKNLFSNVYLQISYQYSSGINLPSKINDFQKLINLIIGIGLIIVLLFYLVINEKLSLFSTAIGLILGALFSIVYQQFMHNYVIHYFSFEYSAFYISFTVLSLAVILGIILLIIDLRIVRS